MSKDKIIDLSKVRNERERPDPEFVKHDDFGREMFLYTLDYEFKDGHWATELWAYNAEDADARVAAMRESLKNMGQIYTVIHA